MAMPAWSVKTRRAPSGIVGMRGSTHGHTTTAIHDEYTPSPYRTAGSLGFEWGRMCVPIYNLVSVPQSLGTQGEAKFQVLDMGK